VGLIPGAVNVAGEDEGLPVACVALAKVPANPVQSPGLVKRLGFTAPVADVAGDVWRRLQRIGRPRNVRGQAPQGP